MCTTKTTKATKEENDPTYDIIGCAINVHRELGPGLLETVYEQCLAHELADRGFNFTAQVPLPVIYRGFALDCGYRLDLVIEDCVIIEIKSVEQILKIHQAQILTYMKLAKIRLGLLINFNAVPLKNGIKRFRLSDPSWS